MKLAFVLIEASTNRKHKLGGDLYNLYEYIKAKNKYSKDIDIEVLNFNYFSKGAINIFSSAVTDTNPDVIVFISNFYNIEMIKKMGQTIKFFLPSTKIIISGFEVSYNSETLLNDNPHIDFIVRGESEITLNELVTYLYEDNYNYSEILGITYVNSERKIISNDDRGLKENIDDFPSPYLSGNIDFSQFDGEVVYETARGCIYNCSYCIHTKGYNCLRIHSLERIEEELNIILNSKDIKLLFFVDNTFNADEERAIEILKTIEKVNPNMPLAFEMRPDLLSDKIINQLSKLNLSTVGVGLQTCFPEINKIVNRYHNIDKIKENLIKLKQATKNTCKLFDVDLIYGLPGDCYENYKSSVNFLLELGTHIYYQPLRIFRGTNLFDDIHKFNFIYDETAPYNTICNNTYSIKDMIKSYCLNVGLDYINRGGIFREAIDMIIEDKESLLYVDVLEEIGKYFWNNKIYEAFRVANWTIDDRDEEIIFRDFYKSICNLDKYPISEYILEKLRKYALDNKYSIKDEHCSNNTYASYYFNMTF